MKRDEDNALALLIKYTRRAWWHRPGVEPIGQVLDVFEALDFETKTGMKPVLCHKHKTPVGWHLVFNLPAGISSAQVIAQIDHFREQTGGAVSIQVKGSRVHFDLFTTPIPKNVPFEWNPDNYADMDLPLPIGQTAAGLHVIDLARLPHLFVAGLTGGGKTNALRVFSVALLHRPIVLVVIDLKGLDFQFLNQHALIADTQQLASQALSALEREMDRRREVLKQAGATKVQEYSGDDLPYIVAIIDELGELTEKDDQQTLNRLARLARATGISLIAATQRPAHSLYKNFTDTRSQFSGALCFAVKKQEDSRLILDSDSASHLPADIPGRAIFKFSEEIEVQSPHLGMKEAKQIISQLSPKEAKIFECSSARLLPR